MQYVWQYRLWPVKDMVTTDGRRIEVLDPGILNKDAGPDFFNAKVTIGGCHWAGNVEIHVRASDWFRHRHDKDPAYDSVVLHVVEVPDAVVHRSNGEEIPVMIMTCARDFSRRYNEMVNDPLHELPCGRELPGLDRIYLHDWLTALAWERLYAKADRIFGLLKHFKGSWADAIYVTLARALGFGTNAEPFQLLAMSTPLKCLLHHSDSVRMVEAVLFGQAGLLRGTPTDDYQKRLTDDYRFLAAKYSLEPSRNLLWKMGRMRPQNFPHRRVAALAQLVAGDFPFSSNILAIETEQQARELFDIKLSEYWADHFCFSDPCGMTGLPALSKASVTVLLINVIVPVIFAHSYMMGNRERQSFAVELLSRLQPESNSIIDIFGRAGIQAENAFMTQAMIELRRQYCQQRKCLFCRIGHHLLSTKVKA